MHFIHRALVALSMALLTACMSQPPAESAFVVTPEPGLPAFQQPSEEPEGYPNPSTPAPGGYPAPSAETSSAYPGATQPTSNSVDGRSQSALTSYKIAEEVAKRDYSPDVKLYAVVPSTIMISNLGGMPVLPGWFYRFKTPGSTRQFIVQVVDESVSGTTVAEPIEEPQPVELPIDISQVKIDSGEVLERFQKVAAERNIQTEGVTYDLELVSLEGRGGPTWSVVDPATRQWLYSISAINGNEVANPHQ